MNIQLRQTAVADPVFNEALAYRTLFWIVLLAFAVRVAVRCYSGSDDFWVNGYQFFFELAQNIAAGNGIAFGDGHPIVGRVPLYPAFLAAITFGHKLFVPIVLFQSLIGAGTVLCAALIAREMFGSAAAIIAATITALYPYYVVHDTALQETSLYTFLLALAIVLLLRVRRSGSRTAAACAGVVLGAAVLTRASLAPFALLAPIWLVIPGVFRAGAWRQGLWAAVICAGALALTLSPWLIRSYHLTGSAVLSSKVGYQLWAGNNPYTFSHYPYESMDHSIDAAAKAFSVEEIAEMEPLVSDERAIDNWLQRRGVAYISEHPWQTLGSAFRKIAASFGWLPSPRRSFWPTLVHSLSYGLITTLGLWAIWVSRSRWREYLLFYALFVSCALVVAVFHGHTSARAYLDVYLIVFAAGTLEQLRSRCFPSTASSLSMPIQAHTFHSDNRDI